MAELAELAWWDIRVVTTVSLSLLRLPRSTVLKFPLLHTNTVLYTGRYVSPLHSLLLEKSFLSDEEDLQERSSWILRKNTTYTQKFLLIVVILKQADE